MIIFRYLTKEVLISLAAMTIVLIFIFMSNQFILYLNRAANGNIPVGFLLKLMMFELPMMVGFLLPLGLYVSFLVAYGRLYSESEMTVLMACGYSPTRLLLQSFMIATPVALSVLLLMLWLNPMISKARNQLLRSTGVQTLIQLLQPGRFQSTNGGKLVYYVGSMNRGHTEGKQIFLAQLNKKDQQEQWSVLWSKSGKIETDPKTGVGSLILEEGRKYEGRPGASNFQVAEFNRFKARLPQPTLKEGLDIRTVNSKDLLPFNNPNPVKSAEMQWRLSISIMVMILTLIAVPLSRVSPRRGKYANLFPAIGIFIIYANLLFVSRNWIVTGKTPLWLGMWWIHALFGCVGLLLIWRNQVSRS